MLQHEISKLKTGPADLRKFGLLVGGVFALLSMICWWRGKPGLPYWLAAALPLMVLGWFWPASLKWPYLIWMSIGLGLGLIVSTVLLTLFFYLFVTPVGLLARATGKDFLRLRLERTGQSYWIQRPRRPRQPQQYEQQF